MICKHCGSETDSGESHASQGECIRALQARIRKLEDSMTAHSEVAFYRGSNLRSLYHQKIVELQALKEQLRKKEEIVTAVKKALKRGTKKSWENLLNLLAQREKKG